MRNYFKYPLEEFSETTNNQALLFPFIITKMKACMRAEGGGLRGTLYPGVDCPPPPHVHRGETSEIVSSILLKGIQKLHMTRLSSIPLNIT